MQIELWPIDRVKPYPNNPRVNKDAVAAVAASLKEFGWRQPIVVDQDGVIIVGHTRLKAAKLLGYTEVPVHTATDLSPEQIKAYRIADNQTATIADWDKLLLPLELADLQCANYDLSLLGFTQDVLLGLIGTPPSDGQCDPDEVPAPPDEATTKPGDLWLLGKHRLLCGDSSKPDQLDQLLNGAEIHLVNSDPPYGVNVEPRSNNAIAAGLSTFPGTKSKATSPKKLRAKDRPIANDAAVGAEFDKLLDAWFGNFSRVLVPGRSFYIWGGYANLGNYPPALKKHELYFSQGIIWDKQHPVISRKDFMGSFEICYYGWKAGAAHTFLGPNNATDLWHVKKLNHTQMVHLTEKPTELAVRAMQYSSRPGENVLDLFGGSGSTLIAAEQVGRNAYLMELDPLYCDVIVQRYQSFTGKPAVLESTGDSPFPMKTEAAA
jgi:DNA modification methylase